MNYFVKKVHLNYLSDYIFYHFRAPSHLLRYFVLVLFFFNYKVIIYFYTVSLYDDLQILDLTDKGTFYVSEASGATDENGVTRTFTVRLSSQPDDGDSIRPTATLPNTGRLLSRR